MSQAEYIHKAEHEKLMQVTNVSRAKAEGTVRNEVSVFKSAK